MIHDILDHGARGDGSTNDAGAIQRAIDACHAAGGGTVLVPAGRTYLSGSIALKAHVELHVERGATLRASTERADYGGYTFGGTPVFISGVEAHGAAIAGPGTIDGQGRRFMTSELPHMYRSTLPWRPHLVCVLRCRGFTVRDVTLRDSANWALHLTGCVDVLVHGIRILNDLKVPNCDGIDPDHCRNVRISDCHIEAGDDCIVLKNRAEYPELGPSENIVITNCTLISTSCAVKIGTESIDDFRAIVVSNCVIRGSHRGLGIQLRDRGDVEDVLFANCVIETRHFHEDWWGGAEPIHVTAFPRRAGAPVGTVRRVRFRDIHCRGESGAVIASHEPGHLEDITLDGVRLEVDRWTGHRGDILDRRPCGMAGVVPRQVSGVHAVHVRDLVLREVDIRWGNVQPYHAHAIEAHACPGLRLVGGSGQAAHPHLPAQRIEADAPDERLLEQEQRGNESAGA